MTQPTSNVQQALCLALLRMMRSGNLTKAESDWVQQFAVRVIAEFNLLKSKREGDAPVKPIAA